MLGSNPGIGSAWGVDAGDLTVRAWTLQHFPFRVVYRVRGTTMLVVAVAHTRRLPDYWSERL